MKQGDIYLVDFGKGAGHEYSKTRPALIMQNPELIKQSETVTMIPITSQTGKMHEPDVFVAKDKKNKLHSDSVVKVEHVYSKDKRFIQFKIGEVNSPTLRRVRGYLRKHFLF